ncbi:MAG: ribonuclease HII [Bacteroidales bacterium]|nr:ribonuclease HII [Bacteroidales bacterium]MCF8404202.1 ribonuclease HII [Bacteroidales bacterium]
MLKPYFTNNKPEAGCDEAGRGCLAGPVFAAAVILPTDFFHPLLNDSKKLSSKQRNILKSVIEKEAAAWSVAQVDNIKIDEINILNASILAMHKAIDGLKLIPKCLIIDGNRFKPYHNIPYHCIVKGDGKYASIAAASVLAKTYRDEFMLNAHKDYPMYGWDKNKGYPTKLHKSSLSLFGITPLHRKSFNLSEQIKINF